jgi:hypothetical protein
MKYVLNTGRAFIDINKRDSEGHTILKNLAGNQYLGYTAEKFAALLDAGADIHARDSSGRTSLHIAILTAKQPDEPEREVCAIILLIERIKQIKRREDIFASDDRGRSIFDDAYECDHSRWSLGSYRCDLWDHVLIRCDLGELIRPPEERIYHYTDDYTEDHFRSLWKGWEHLFPYSRETSSACPVLILEDESEDDESEDDEYEDWDEDENDDEGEDREEEDADED